MRTSRSRYWDDIIARRRFHHRHRSGSGSVATLFTMRAASLLALLLLLGLPLSCEEEAGREALTPSTMRYSLTSFLESVNGKRETAEGLVPFVSR